MKNKKELFLQKLGKELMFFDGAMGTLLQKRGLKSGELPEAKNITDPAVIEDIHSRYLKAGCNILKANTFGANSYKCKDSGYAVSELVRSGIENARNAINNTGVEAFVAMDVGALGKIVTQNPTKDGEISFDQAYDSFAQAMKAGEEAGADLILIETVNQLYEIKAAILAAKENTQLPVLITFIFDLNGRLLTGSDIKTAVILAQSLGVEGVGFNCGYGQSHTLSLLPQMLSVTSLPVIVNPNAGLPKVENGVTVFDAGPEEFAEEMLKAVEMGVSVVGGCCGTTPEHIKALHDKCKDISFVKERTLPCKTTSVTSYTHTVTFGEAPVIIGERINPTGKALLKQALRQKDMEYILKEAISQQESGAHILDVNVGLPEINEPEMMEEVIVKLQAVTDLPLQIDTTNIEAMERGLRYYNGKPLLNSVNGKEESMNTVFPLAKKYGASVVCLCLDEEGIPSTPEGRLKIAEKIVRKAESYGIDRSELLVDTLTLSVSTGSDSGLVTLKALELVKDNLGVKTVLGVSNVSFGLPQRVNVNAAFFTMALQKGLSAGIVNPMSDEMMSSYYSFKALAGFDENCSEYISRYGGTKEKKADNGKVFTLKESILKGLTGSAKSCTAQLLNEGIDSLEIINSELVPALDEVGKGFESNKVFLPQLLMSAEAAKAAFEEIKAYLESKGAVQEAKGTIVIATVKGDVHDIGKNIVKVLLENYGFNVIDLGKDVPPEEILKAAIQTQAPLVGLSALMTTTVESMEKTIKLLKKDYGKCKIMVGGAVLTQEYADMIGADFYSPDAMGSVRYAQKLFEE